MLIFNRKSNFLIQIIIYYQNKSALHTLTSHVHSLNMKQKRKSLSNPKNSSNVTTHNSSLYIFFISHPISSHTQFSHLKHATPSQLSQIVYLCSTNLAAVTTILISSGHTVCKILYHQTIF